MRCVKGEVMKAGEIHTFKVVGITHDGCGIGMVDGSKVFIDGVLPGETVEALITKAGEEQGAARVLDIVGKRAGRVKPFCRYFGKCGSCGLQFIDYGKQLKVKTGMVRDALCRGAGLESSLVCETIGMEKPEACRNRAGYPVAFRDGRVLVGFYGVRSNDVVEVGECAIQHPASNAVREVVKGYIEDMGLSVYDKESGKGLVRHIVTRVGFKTGEVMVILVINGEGILDGDRFVEAVLQAVPGVRSIYLNINKEDTNMVMGNENVLLYGSKFISDYIGSYRFEISPLSFFQVNPLQTEVLYEKVLEYSGLTGNETVMDLYCGTGTIGIYLSGKAKKVIGVEAVGEAVEDARRNGEINGVDNIEFYVGRVEDAAVELCERGEQADVVILDPPRKGCKRAVLDTVIRMGPKRVVYVSCNPSTLGRDLRYFSEVGYGVVEVQPLDMFPHVGHVECCVLIERMGQ